MPQSAIRGLSFIIAFSPTPLEVAAGNGGKGSRTLTNETKVETDGKQQKRPYITSGHVWSTNKLWPHVHQWRPKRPSVQQTHKRFVYVSFWPNGIMAMLPLPEKKCSTNVNIHCFTLTNTLDSTPKTHSCRNPNVSISSLCIVTFLLDLVSSLENGPKRNSNRIKV